MERARSNSAEGKPSCAACTNADLIFFAALFVVMPRIAAADVAIIGQAPGQEPGFYVVAQTKKQATQKAPAKIPANNKAQAKKQALKDQNGSKSSSFIPGIYYYCFYDSPAECQKKETEGTLDIGSAFSFERSGTGTEFRGMNGSNGFNWNKRKDGSILSTFTGDGNRDRDKGEKITCSVVNSRIIKCVEDGLSSLYVRK